MRTILLACRTMEDEILGIRQRKCPELPVVWIPSGLHNVPANLHACLQQALDDLPPVDRVLLAMGACGNSLSGIRCGPFHMIVPKADDCISLMLGGKGSHVNTCKGVYFLTAGWLRGERSLMAEYNDAVRKYGEQRGNRIFRSMLRHFTDLALLDTGYFDSLAAGKETREIALRFGLNYREIPADLSFLEQLLTGPWPEDRFLSLAPGQTITSEMLI